MVAIRKGELVAWLGVVSWAMLIFTTVALTPLLRRWIAENLGKEAFTFIVLTCILLAFLWALATWWRNSPATAPSTS